MSIVVRYAPVPSSTIEQYDEVMRRLQESGEMPADGFDYHVAFLSEGQLLVSEVWDSPEQLQAFGARIMPLLADVALEHSGQPGDLRGAQHHQALTRISGSLHGISAGSRRPAIQKRHQPPHEGGVPSCPTSRSVAAWRASCPLYARAVESRRHDLCA